MAIITYAQATRPMVQPDIDYAIDLHSAARLFCRRCRSGSYVASSCINLTAGARDTWCLGATTYLVLAFRLMTRCHSDRIKLRAAIQDDSGILILGLILLAIFSSFSAIF